MVKLKSDARPTQYSVLGETLIQEELLTSPSIIL